MREGLVAVLGRDASVTVTAAADVATALGMVHRQPPDVLVVSHDPPVLDGLDLMRKLVRPDGSRPAAAVLLSSTTAEDEMLEALKGGVRGLLPKGAAARSVVSAIHDVNEGALVLAVPPAIRLIGRLVGGTPSSLGRRPQALAALTGRELDVLGLVAKGHSNRGIAAQLAVSEATVKSHLYHLCRKLNLRDRTHAAIVAYETGLIRPAPYAASG
jgi:DNA-binding NarL/FixJ family response regulator